MHEELVKRLREPCQYENCVLCQQAADAIEKLQQTAEHYKGCSDDWYRAACDYKAICEQMKATVIIEAQHIEMYDERDKKTLVEMAKSLPLRIIPYNGEKPRWIPVSEKKPPLPEDEDVCFVDVIAAVRGRKESAQVKYYRAYRYLDGKRECIERFIDDWEVVDVTHWMPMPEPPKEGKK